MVRWWEEFSRCSCEFLLASLEGVPKGVNGVNFLLGFPGKSKQGLTDDKKQSAADMSALRRSGRISGQSSAGFTERCGCKVFLRF